MLLAAGTCLLAGCGGGKSGSSTAKAKAEIERNWEIFFDGSTESAKRRDLLERGAEFDSVLKLVAASPLAKQVKAEVSSVEVDGDSAKVTYTLLFDKRPVLKDATGTAVLVDGVWKVGTGSFCQLLALQGATPKSCSATAK